MSISRINNNITSIISNNNVARTGRALTKSIERLSSGLRINRAGDDAAGLTIATRLRSQVRGIDRAIMNAEDGINVINVAEGAMEEMIQRLDRIRELSIQAANTGVNDIQARQSMQDEVFQSIDELTRIADTTRYNTNYLLNGDYSVDAQIKPGQDGINQFGVRIDNGPGANTLESGQHFLNIIQTKVGGAAIIAGEDEIGDANTMHTGITNASDIAVTLTRFSSTIGNNGTAAVAGDAQGAGLFINGVSIAVADKITFAGVLSDGITAFSGSLSVSAATVLGSGATAGSMVEAVNIAIDDAEMALFGVNTTADVPTAFRTTVTLAGNATDNRGRLLMVSDVEAHNFSSIDFGLERGNFSVTQSDGVTRSGAIGINSVLSGGGQIGNSVLAITGSTFSTGNFAIDIQDIQQAQSRIVESSIVFRDATGSIINRTTSLTSTRGLSLNGTFVEGSYTSGISISDGDTLTLRGIDSDGTSFEGIYTFADSDPAADVDTSFNDFVFGTISGLIDELNYRSRDYSVAGLDGTQTRFESALFTLSQTGTLQLVDDIGRSNSQLSFSIIINDSDSTATNPYTISDKADLVREGFAEQATIRINGGPEVRAEAGELIHYIGPETTVAGDVRDEVLFRLGTNLKKGADYLDIHEKEYVGQLNGGPAVTFQNGAQDVTFIDAGTMDEGVARQLTLDFDAILDVTSTNDATPDPGTTIVLSVNNTSMNFHIGAYADQNFQTTIGDLSSLNLGYGRGSGRTVGDIDVRSLEGANEALRIVDKALNQINRTRSLLGAATNRLESSIANLSVASENLLTSESRLRDVDIAKESSNFTQQQVLLQAGVSVLAQSNFLPQQFLSLIG